jgi:hypothetical protein
MICSVLCTDVYYVIPTVERFGNNKLSYFSTFITACMLLWLDSRQLLLRLLSIMSQFSHNANHVHILPAPGRDCVRHLAL